MQGERVQVELRRSMRARAWCAMMPGLCSVGCRLTSSTSPSFRWRQTFLTAPLAPSRPVPAPSGATAPSAAVPAATPAAPAPPSPGGLPNGAEPLSVSRPSLCSFDDAAAVTALRLLSSAWMVRRGETGEFGGA